MARRRDSRTKAALASIILALVALVALAFAPTGSQQEALQVVGPGGEASPAEVRVTHPSLFDTQGSSVLIPLSIPVGLAVIGFLVRRWRGALGVVVTLMWLFSLLGAASIGLFYFPATAAMVIALAVPGPQDRTAPLVGRPSE